MTQDTHPTSTVDSQELPSLRPVVLPLSGLLIAQFTLMLSGTVVATALPTLMSDLPGPSSHAAWMVAATILANSATTPIWGKLTDRFNPKYILMSTLTLFIVASIGAGFSISTSMLLVFRTLQGVSFGGLMAAIAVVIAHLVSARQRGRVNGWFTSAQTTSMIAGPVVGGLIVEAPFLGWQWCFFVLAPAGLISLLVIARTLRIAMPRRTRRGRLDLGGAFLIATGITALLIGITALSEGPDSILTLVICLAYAVLALAAFVLVELKAQDPVIPLRLLGNRVTVLSLFAALLVGSMFFVGTVFVTQYVQFGLGMSPATSGLLQIPMAIMTIIATLGAGRFMSATARVKPVLVLGVLSILIGSVLLVVVNWAPVPLAIAGTIFIGMGLGATMQNLAVAPQNRAPLEHVGAVTASVLFMFTLGGAVGLIVYGAVANALVDAAMLTGLSLGQAYFESMPWVFLVGVGVVIPALILVLFIPSVRLKSAREVAAEPEAKPAV